MIINSTFISLDGVVQNPHEWPPTSGGLEDPAGEELETELLFGCDAVLMGRKTYDAFAAVWPTRSGDPFSDRMNSMPKYVVSSTLENPSWIVGRGGPEDLLYRDTVLTTFELVDTRALKTGTVRLVYRRRSR